MNGHQPQPKVKREEIEVTDLNDFVVFLTNWHQHRLTKLEYLKKLPEGTELTIGEEPLLLKGDVLKAFVLGLDMSINELGVLPFSAEFEQADVH